MDTLGFGIVGVGNIAQVHATAIQAAGAKLVAVATRNPERGRAFAAEHGGTWHADYRAVLARDDVSAIVLCTPHDLHAPMTLDAAAARKHVVCEKPMARNVAECDAMIAACERAGVTLGVIYQSRFEPISLKTKALLDAGKLGRLLWSSASTLWYRSDEYYQSAPWRGSRAQAGGGVLINQASHAIDLLLWLGGMPVRITARTRTLDHDIEVEDGAVAIMEYPDDRLGLIQATTIAHPGYPERLEFFGARGSAVLHKGQARLEWHLLEPRQDGEEQAEVSSGAARPMDISDAGHIAQMQDFVAAIRERRRPLVDGHEGRKSIEVIEAIYRSAAANAPVSLPLA